jgi:hypothetical protein
MSIVANLWIISWRGEFLPIFQRKLPPSYCHQDAYIQFHCGRASNDYTGVLIMYVLILRNRSYELSPSILTDGHSKVTTARHRWFVKVLTDLCCWRSKLVIWSLGGFFVRELHPSEAYVRCSIRASTVVVTGTTVAQVLYMRTYSSEPLACYYILFAESTHSCLVVWIPTGLSHLEPWECRYAMAGLVRIIQFSIGFIINQYCRIAGLSLEGVQNTANAGPLWLKKPRRSHASHSLQGSLIISKSNESDVRHSRYRHCIFIEHQSFRIAVLARDSTIYFVIIFGRWIETKQSFTLIIADTIAGLALTMANLIHTIVPFSTLPWVDILCM